MLNQIQKVSESFLVYTLNRDQQKQVKGGNDKDQIDNNIIVEDIIES